MTVFSTPKSARHRLTSRTPFSAHWFWTFRQPKTYAGTACSSSTAQKPTHGCVTRATKKEQTQAHRTAPDEQDAPLSCSKRHRPCSTARQRTVVPRSGRRGRRFKSCHPDHRHRSPTCANAALRWPALHSSPPADAPKEQKRNTREPQG